MTRTHSTERVKDGKIKQSIRSLVWKKYFGSQTYYCWCCGINPICALDFECGHVKARAKGGTDSVDNLRPICGSCNRGMMTTNMLDYQKEHNLPARKIRRLKLYHPRIVGFFEGTITTIIMFIASYLFYIYYTYKLIIPSSPSRFFHWW